MAITRSMTRKQALANTTSGASGTSGAHVPSTLKKSRRTKSAAIYGDAAKGAIRDHSSARGRPARANGALITNNPQEDVSKHARPSTAAASGQGASLANSFRKRRRNTKTRRAAQATTHPEGPSRDVTANSDNTVNSITGFMPSLLSEVKTGAAECVAARTGMVTRSQKRRLEEDNDAADASPNPNSHPNRRRVRPKLRHTHPTSVCPSEAQRRTRYTIHSEPRRTSGAKKSGRVSNTPTCERRRATSHVDDAILKVKKEEEEIELLPVEIIQTPKENGDHVSVKTEEDTEHLLVPPRPARNTGSPNPDSDEAVNSDTGDSTASLVTDRLGSRSPSPDFLATPPPAFWIPEEINVVDSYGEAPRAFFDGEGNGAEVLPHTTDDTQDDATDEETEEERARRRYRSLAPEPSDELAEAIRSGQIPTCPSPEHSDDEQD